MKKIISNLFYQVFYQIVKILIPIITIPIASKALGASGIGLNSFSNSIAQYFVLLSGLGISLYGNREIAVNRDSGKLKQTFFDIFIMKLITTIASLVLYYLLIIFFFAEYKLLFFIQSIYIISVVFDVSWFYMGIEDFKKTSLASFLSQVLIFLLIIKVIKSPNDIYLYAGILSVGNLLAQLIPILFLKNIIEKSESYQFDYKNIVLHFKGTIKYFIPQIGILLYSTVNKTMLGMFSDFKDVGYYTNSMNLISAIITVITTIDLVMLPRMSNLFSKNKSDEVDGYVSKSLSFELFLSIPCAVGIISISKLFVPIFFGTDFLELIIILPLESVLLIIVPIGVSISRQYLIPMGNTKDYTISIFIGGIVNIILLMLLIKTIGVYAAILSNIASELFVTLYRIRWSNKNTMLKIDKLNLFKITFSSLVMGVVVFFLSNISSASILSMLAIVFIGMIVFMLFCLLLKVNEIMIIKKILKR